MQTIYNHLVLSPRRPHLLTLGSEWKGELLVCVPWPAGHLIAKGYEHIFYALLTLQPIIFVFEKCEIAIAAPKVLRSMCMSSICTLPLRKSCASIGSSLLAGFRLVEYP